MYLQLKLFRGADNYFQGEGIFISFKNDCCSVLRYIALPL